MNLMSKRQSGDGLLTARQLFRLWLGVTEYLFRNPELLDEALDTAIDDTTFRSDDLEFTFAARVSPLRMKGCVTQPPELVSTGLLPRT